MKKTLVAFLFLIVAFSCNATSQDWSSFWETAKKNAATVSEPEWVKLVNPVVVPDDPYKDIHSWQCGQFYNDVHEQSHFVMNWFSNSWKAYVEKKQVLYCLKGRLIVLDEPPLTIADVASVVPNDKRGSVYQMYLIDQQSGWNKQPLYILNEAVSYSNEFDWDGKVYGLDKAAEMTYYATVMLSLAEKCKDYNSTKLKAFINWLQNRIDEQRKKPVSEKKEAVNSSCPTGNCPNATTTRRR